MPHYYIVGPQNSVQHYNCWLMELRRLELDISGAEIARRTGMTETTVRNVFLGKATNRHVYPVVKILGLDWDKVHNLDLKESDFHTAVSNGNGKSHLAE